MFARCISNILRPTYSDCYISYFRRRAIFLWRELATQDSCNLQQLKALNYNNLKHLRFSTQQSLSSHPGISPLESSPWCMISSACCCCCFKLKRNRFDYGSFLSDPCLAKCFLACELFSLRFKARSFFIFGNFASCDVKIR